MNKFITFEGGEGSGKSTLINNLVNYFNDNNINYIATREPGGVKFSENIRNILKYSTEPFGIRAELLLFSASRAEVVDKLIKPNLEAGKVVVCDRFFDSTRVYQGYANDISDEAVMSITNFATNGLTPAVTFFLDIDPVEAFKRKGGRDEGDRIEERDIDYHNKVREGYLNLCKKEERFVKLDATKTPQELLDEVVEILKMRGII